MNAFKSGIKKSFFTVIFFLTSMATFAGHCFPGDPGCETDDPLDSYVLILMFIVALFAIYSLNKKANRVSIAK